MFAGLSLEMLALLVAIAFAGGIGITTIGPGGIFVTISLYVFTPLSSAVIAGTAHATFISTGILGTVAYFRSGELTEEKNHALATILCGSSVVGALVGAQLNTYVSRQLFGVLLGIAAGVAGIVLLYREWQGLDPRIRLRVTTQRGKGVLAGLGFGLGVAAGLVGIGGPVLAVPALVILGIPILVSLAIAQIQSVFISGVATMGYLANDAVSLWFVLLIGVPQLFGVVVGWQIAHKVDPSRLTTGLGVVLVVVGGYLFVS